MPVISIVRDCRTINYCVKVETSNNKAEVSIKIVVPSELLRGTCKVVKAVKTRYAKSATKTREAKILSNFNLLLLFLLFLFLEANVFFLAFYRPSKHIFYTDPNKHNVKYHVSVSTVSKKLKKNSFPL